MNLPSYTCGPQEKPLLAMTIGAAFDQTVSRFAEREARKSNRFALKGLIEQQLSTADAASWEARLNAAGIPAGQVLSMEQALGQPQVKHRQLFASVPFGQAGRAELQLARSGFHVDGQATGPATVPPLHGEHGDAILRELNLAALA